MPTIRNKMPSSGSRAVPIPFQRSPPDRARASSAERCNHAHAPRCVVRAATHEASRRKEYRKRCCISQQDVARGHHSASHASPRTQAQRRQALRRQAQRRQALRRQALRRQTLRRQALRTQTLRRQALRTQTLRRQALRRQALRAARAGRRPGRIDDHRHVYDEATPPNRRGSLPAVCLLKL